MKNRSRILRWIWIPVLLLMMTVSHVLAEDVDPLEQLYGSTPMEHVYNLNRVLPAEWDVKQIDLKDGYILLRSGSSGSEGEKAILLPLSDPDKAVTAVLPPADRYFLLDRGTVVGINEEDPGCVYTLYNTSLEATAHGMTEGRFIGFSGDGDLWFLTEDARLSLIREGETVMTLDTGDLWYGTYLGRSGGRSYFDMVGNERGQCYLWVDPESRDWGEVRMLYDVLDASGDSVCYFSPDRWYIADLADPLKVTAFTKPDSQENMWIMDDRYMISRLTLNDTDTHTLHYDYRVYDRHTGGLCDQRSEADLALHSVTALAYDRGLFLYTDADPEAEQPTLDLYLWDARPVSDPPKAPRLTTLDFHIDRERVESLIGILHNIYNINIYYDEEHLSEIAWSYRLVPCTDLEKLGFTLVMLREWMAEYPTGFFDEIRTDEFTELNYYLCDGHTPLKSDVYANADATSFAWKGVIGMTYDVNLWWDFRATFLHENTHMLEHRLKEEGFGINGIDYASYWLDRLNSPEYPSMQSYVWESTEENHRGVFGFEEENAWYIDDYAKCNALEDRARVMEKNLRSEDRKYFTSPHLDRKSRFLNALIRECLPCVRDSERPVLWEKRTGIVDLYEEFPDFAGVR